MYTITLSKFKGGVAATETTVQLATLYALAGWRVLVVDTDPQGGATKRLLAGGSDNALTLADAVKAYVADRKNPAISLSQVICTAQVRGDLRKKEFSTVSVVPANRNRNRALLGCCIRRDGLCYCVSTCGKSHN